MIDLKARGNGYGLLIGIMVAGFVLRVIGLNFGQPFRYHPDELKLVYWAGNLLQFHKWSPQIFFLIGVYPPLYAFVLALAFGIYSLFLVLFQVAPDMTAVQAFYYTEPFQYHMLGRWISALSGTISIFVIYLIGKRAYSHATGLVAALFLAVSFLHVRNSHFGVVDALLILFILLSFYYTIKILSQPTGRNYLLAVIYAAAATATKWNAAFIILPFIFAHFINNEKNGLWQKLLHRKMLISVLTGVVAFLIFCPLPIFDFSEWWGGVIGTARFQQTGATKLGAGGGFFSYFTGNHSPGYGFFYDNNFVAGLGLFATLFFVLGIICLIWRHKKMDLLILIFPIAMYLLLGNMKYKAMRHVLPMVPFLLLIAAEFVTTFAELLKAPVFKRIVLVTAIALATIPTGWKALRYDLALAQVDTRSTMKEWIEENIPPGSKIGMEEFHPPLLALKDLNLEKIIKSPHYKAVYDVYGLVPNMFVHGQQKTDVQNPANYIMENNIRYIVLDSFTSDRYHWKYTRLKNAAIVRQRDQFYEWVANNSKELYRVAPDNNFNISPELVLYEIN